MQPVPGSQNAFQIQITGFASQKALLTPHGKPEFNPNHKYPYETFGGSNTKWFEH